MAKSPAPRCPVHVSTPMVVVKRTVPFVLAAEYADPKYKIHTGRNGSSVPRRFFRCPIKSCTRVERVPNEFENAA